VRNGWEQHKGQRVNFPFSIFQLSFFPSLAGTGRLENGKWKMENGKWKMENGKWKMENGKWSVRNSTGGR
jgi:hypothetical protein